MWLYFLIPLANQSELCYASKEPWKNWKKQQQKCLKLHPKLCYQAVSAVLLRNKLNSSAVLKQYEGFSFLSQAFLFLVCSHNKGMPQCYVINWQAGLINTANNIIVHALISKNTFPALFNYVCVWRSSLLSSLLPHDLMIVFLGLLTCVGVV